MVGLFQFSPSGTLTGQWSIIGKPAQDRSADQPRHSPACTTPGWRGRPAGPGCSPLAAGTPLPGLSRRAAAPPGPWGCARSGGSPSQGQQQLWDAAWESVQPKSCPAWSWPPAPGDSWWGWGRARPGLFSHHHFPDPPWHHLLPSTAQQRGCGPSRVEE